MAWRIKAGPAGIMVLEESPDTGAPAELGPFPNPAAAREAIATRKDVLGRAIGAFIAMAKQQP